MAYTETNFPTKAALKRAIKDGAAVYVYEPGVGSLPKLGGRVFLEGPHYPKPHRWYAEAQIDQDRKVISIK